MRALMGSRSVGCIPVLDHAMCLQVKELGILVDKDDQVDSLPSKFGLHGVAR